jgi:Luciferase-like monooxygenase
MGSTVKVGVWFDLRNPPGWRQDPARFYGFTLELCEEAERLGAASLWFSEHHGFEDGYLPQPLTFAAAAAARTSRVRLGTGILVGPLRKTPRLAEETAVVDIVSGARLDLGLGAGYRVPEFELCGAAFAARYRTLDQQVAELRRLWGDGDPDPRTQRLTRLDRSGHRCIRRTVLEGWVNSRRKARAFRCPAAIMSASSSLRSRRVPGPGGPHQRAAVRASGPRGLRGHRPAALAAHRGTFVHQRGEGDPPAAVDLAEPVVVRHPDSGQEDLVEVAASGHSGAAGVPPPRGRACRRGTR